MKSQDQKLVTDYLPQSYEVFRKRASESQAYFDCSAYPYFQLADWRTETQGPLPIVQPLVSTTISDYQGWIFASEPYISTGIDKLDSFLNQIYTDNKLTQKLQDLSKMMLIHGTAAFRFDFSTTDELFVKIQVLNVVDNCKLYYDPLDSDKLIAARIEFPYYEEGQWNYYREDWFIDKVIYYKTQKDTRLKFAVDNNPYSALNFVEGTWKIDREIKNPYGCIPIVVFKNNTELGTYGLPEIKPSLFRLLDKINISYYLQDRSNQFSTLPSVIYKDLEIPIDQVDRPLAPGEKEVVVSTEGKNGEVSLLEPHGRLREHLSNYTKDLTETFMNGVSLQPQANMEVKGAITETALEFLYRPVLRIAKQKRGILGEGMIELYKKLVAVSYKFSILPQEYTKAKYSINWETYWQLTEEEKKAKIENLKSMKVEGMITEDLILRELAKIHGLKDIERLKRELEAEKVEESNKGTVTNAYSIEAEPVVDQNMGGPLE